MIGKGVGEARKNLGQDAGTAEQAIDAKIASLSDWRGVMLASIRTLIRQADPAIVEDVKWRKPSNPLGVPVWSREGILCTGETYKDKVKLTFAQGASLPDPSRLFNASCQRRSKSTQNRQGKSPHFRRLGRRGEVAAFRWPAASSWRRRL